MNREWELELERYLGGSLSEEESRAFLEETKRSPELTSQLREAIDQQAMLHELLHAPEARSDGADRRAPRPVSRHKRRAQRTVPVFAWAAAAAAIVLSLALRGPLPAPEILHTESVRAPTSSLASAAIASVVESTGQVSLVRGGVETAAGMDLVIEEDDLLRTDASGRAKIAYAAESTSVEMGPGTVLVLSLERGAKRISLDTGTMTCEVAPQPRGAPLRVVTPHADLEVVGTVFETRVDERGTRLDVREGLVRLTRLADGTTLDVASGQNAIATPDVDLAVRPTTSHEAEGTSVFALDFDVIGRHISTPNELVRLQEPREEVTAIASRPMTIGTAAWKPDVHIEMYRTTPDGKRLAELFAIPRRIEIRIRIKSAEPGRCYLDMQPTDKRSNEESLYSSDFQIDSTWQDVVLHADDFKPYRRPHVHTPDFAPGLSIGGLAFYGYGTSRVLIDTISVVSLPGNDL